jgi:glycosyltransferase involved in cell wall biosynthesis
MPRPLRHLLLVTLEDPHDPRSWSGIPHSLYRALQRRVPQVTVVGGGQLRPRRTPLHSLLRAGLGGGAHPRWPLWMTEPSLRHYATVVEQAIAQHRPDAVLSISSQCLARLHTAVPTYMFHDAPWLAFKQTYARWDKLPLGAQQYARREAEAARRTRLVFTGSAWSIGEGMRLYGLPRARFAEAHLGANWVPSQASEELVGHARARAESLAQGGPLQLLFLGKDWERKGGPLALETATVLHRQGQAVRFHIVGCTPAIPAEAAAFTTVHGVLDLGQTSSRAQLEQLFFASHFLLVPTQAECFGIAFAESQAFAVPPVSRAIHALPSIVVDGETGILLPHNALAAAYVERIRQIVTVPERYISMAANARARFLDCLTWEHAADVITHGIETTLELRLETPPCA